MSRYVVRAVWGAESAKPRRQKYERASLPVRIGGWGTSADVVLNDDVVSAVHVTIAERDGELRVRDESSTNGSYQLGNDGVWQKLIPLKWYPLQAAGVRLGQGGADDIRIEVEVVPVVPRARPEPGGGSPIPNPTVFVPYKGKSLPEVALLEWRGLASLLKRGKRYLASERDPEVYLDSKGDVYRLAKGVLETLQVLLFHVEQSRAPQLELLTTLGRTDLAGEGVLDGQDVFSISRSLLDFSKRSSNQDDDDQEEEGQEYRADRAVAAVDALAHRLESVQALLGALSSALERLEPDTLEEVILALEEVSPKPHTQGER